MTEHPEIQIVAKVVHDAVSEAGRPISREDLIYEVRQVFPRWSRETCRRAFRRARRHLISRGVPLVSDGVDGFILDAGGAVFEQDIRRREKTVKAEMIALASLRSMRPREYARSLFEEVEVGRK